MTRKRQYHRVSVNSVDATLATIWPKYGDHEMWWSRAGDQYHALSMLFQGESNDAAALCNWLSQTCHQICLYTTLGRDAYAQLLTTRNP